MTSPRHLLKAWKEVERRIRRAGQLFLFTDFDGTLVPIVRSPEQARLSPPVRLLLSRLTRKGVAVGIVSGRALADVRGRVGLRGIWYVGSHGYSLYRPGSRPRILLAPAQKARMAEVRRILRQKLGGLARIRVEPKEATVAVHYRNASRRTAAVAAAAIRQVLGIHPRLRLLPGKKVWDLLPDQRTSKWTAIKGILQEERRTGVHLLLFYLGDDSTDEHVFQRMRGISVAVGKRRRTAARFFLRSPGEVRLFLERLCEVAK